jgi:5-methylthioribose kinase
MLRSNFRTPECLRATQEVFMASLLADTLGFAGAKMIRRVLGVAHVEDLESIADKDKRCVFVGKGVAPAWAVQLH